MIEGIKKIQERMTKEMGMERNEIEERRKE